MSGRTAVVCALAIAAGLVGFLVYQISSWDRADHERDAQWIAFSMQHHCWVRVWPTFWSPSTTWECEGGFQVVRGPQ